MTFYDTVSTDSSHSTYGRLLHNVLQFVLLQLPDIFFFFFIFDHQSSIRFSVFGRGDLEQG